MWTSDAQNASVRPIHKFLSKIVVQNICVLLFKVDIVCVSSRRERRPRQKHEFLLCRMAIRRAIRRRPSWAHPGLILGASWAPWAHAGASWATLGASWGHPGASLGASWAYPGRTLGASWAPWDTLGAPWAHPGHMPVRSKIVVQNICVLLFKVDMRRSGPQRGANLKTKCMCFTIQSGRQTLRV